MASKNPVLDELGVTEEQLQQMMADARRLRRTFVVEVPPAVYNNWQEILAGRKTGELTTPEAAARFESEVFPHLQMRPGVDYDKRLDTIVIIPKRRAFSVLAGAKRAGGARRRVSPAPS